jgi:hypothetical protein
MKIRPVATEFFRTEKRTSRHNKDVSTVNVKYDKNNSRYSQFRELAYKNAFPSYSRSAEQQGQKPQVAVE